MLTLEIRIANGAPEIRRFPGPVSIGRDAGDIIVDDPQVSARHAEIRVTSKESVYVDLNSTNGSFTPEGHPISRLQLSVGSTVCFGTSRLTVRGLPGQEGGTRGRKGPTGTLVVDVPVPPSDDAGPASIEIAPGARGTFPVPSKMVRGSTEPAPARPFPLGGPLDPIVVSERAERRAELNLAAPLDVLATCWREYHGHWLPGAALLGRGLGVGALVSTLLGLFAGSLGALLPSLYAAVAALVATWLLLFGCGAMQHYALRLALGHPLGARAAIQIQLASFGAMLRDTLAAVILGALGILLCVVPGVLTSFYLYPAYLIEGRRHTELNRRSFELLQRSPRAAVPTFLIAVAGLLLVYSLVTICLAIPAMSWLSLLLVTLTLALVLPFACFVQYRTYLTLRVDKDGREALERDLRARGLA